MMTNVYFLEDSRGWNNTEMLQVNSANIKAEFNTMSIMKQLEVMQSRPILHAPLNNFSNKTVPCTIIARSQWCITVLIAQGTETFHAFAAEQLRHVCINSD